LILCGKDDNIFYRNNFLGGSVMLGGKLVRLRAYKKEDMILAQKYVNDPETKILLQSSVPYPYTIEDQGKWYENISALKDTYDFAIETLNGVYLGSCGINSVDWKNSKVKVGIFIGDKTYWGRGYGTDAMKILLKFIFQLHSFILMIYITKSPIFPVSLTCYLSVVLNYNFYFI
jgi:RimJ/RimL family protein N-acetyltransferase